jgi:hypothetical protein
MRAMRAALALAGVASMTSCARPDALVARPVAPAAIVDVAPTTTTTAAPVAAAPVATAPSAHVGGSVLVGNQHPLGASAAPFAYYLNAMHKRIHGPFSDEALGRLDGLRPNDPLNDMTLMTNLELVIDGKTGKLVKDAVIRSSGLVGFDALALDAVTRAAPFEPAAPALWSTDGNVYVHWEFRRDPVFGCSTMHVWPFLLDVGSAPP